MLICFLSAWHMTPPYPSRLAAANTGLMQVSNMSRSLKAALFSAFVFPGSGHYTLKRYLRAGLLAGASILCLLILLSTAIEKAQEISFKIQTGEIPLDLGRITAEVSKQVANGGTQQADIATYVLLVCWLAGIIDSFRVGRSQERIERTRNNQPG